MFLVVVTERDPRDEKEGERGGNKETNKKAIGNVKKVEILKKTNKECMKNWLEERQAQKQIHTYLMLYNCFLPFFITDRFHCHLGEIH